MSLHAQWRRTKIRKGSPLFATVLQPFSALILVNTLLQYTWLQGLRPGLIAPQTSSCLDQIRPLPPPPSSTPPPPSPYQNHGCTLGVVTCGISHGTWRWNLGTWWPGVLLRGVLVSDRGYPGGRRFGKIGYLRCNFLISEDVKCRNTQVS